MPCVTARAALLAASALAATSTAWADWKDEVAYPRLVSTFSGVPTSVGTLTQAEAGDTAETNYLPDPSNSEFTGKSIVNQSPGSGLSAHATTVGQFYYGSSTSVLPATPTIDVYSASYWIESDFLRFQSSSAPLTESNRVQNHSWISTAGLTEAQIAEIDQRLDFAINRDGFVAVVGVNNGSSNPLPALLCQAYNHLSVGLTTGNHSAGFTTYDGSGRIKPDIVAPGALTSYATPKVASVAGVLVARGLQSPHSLTGANIPRVVKALLLAGATKEEFSTWARTTARPLDLRYGAGELNALLSYRMLESGRATASGSALVRETGWASTSVSGGSQQTYFFEIPAGAASAPFSAALTWHRLVNDGGVGPAWSPSPVALVNLDLKLYAASGFTPGTLLDQSISTVDNVEHIYAPALAPGRYALVVSSPSGAATTAYGLAWRATPTVTVAAATPVARELDGATGVFTLTRSGATNIPLLVPLSVGGTAQAGVNYTALPTSVVIPAGATSATVTVTPIGDALAQGDRTVVLSVAVDFSVAAGSPASATVTIQDKPYDAWRFAHFDSGQLADTGVSGDSADPDGDGFTNLLEYALGGDPLTADQPPGAPVAALGSDATDSWLTLTYVQPDGRGDLTYTVEWNSDLTAAWQSGSSVVTELSRTAVAGGQQVTVRANATLTAQPRQFLRLRVTRP